MPADGSDISEGGDSSDERVASRAPIGCGLIVTMVVVALLAAGALWVLPRTAQSIDRVERDHAISLPDSARDVQAMGDLVRYVDHGRSAVFVIDAADLGPFVEQLDQVDDVPYRTFVPGNEQYQPSTTPWPKGASPDRTFSKASPAGGDFMHVEIYRLSDAAVGVWLYSDWN